MLAYAQCVDIDAEYEQQARERAREIADLDWNWDGAYSFGWDRASREYTALRPDNGRLLRAGSARELRQLVREDYEAHRVPRPPLRLTD